jgi:DNA-binding MurR/RpiR family transcriptional regulator
MSDARSGAVSFNPADSEQDVLSAVRRKYDELTHSQKRIAEAIVEDPEFVAFATVDKLAERISVAPSTVVRFAYKIGLNGYPDLQERVRKVVRGQMRARPQGDDADAQITSTTSARRSAASTPTRSQRRSRRSRRLGTSSSSAAMRPVRSRRTPR